ncbi:MAG TPA: 4-(cytidine 5'-diphospho)-2-C-methyl-D-erythritol kinase [Hyphomicrobium sp.]|nr:4-(cytidine 5'-diphospho)-2-C-methyl-D-erythritol kinase [Hyphomicrobium sp.]
MLTITEHARAKINLTLRVLGRRTDGYHTLESLIVFADVGDVVRFSPGETPSVEMSGAYAGAITGSNLIDTALERLTAADPALILGRIEVDKQLPIAAGIGGGSADAAAVLRAVHRANPAGKVNWDEIAAGLGADVTVCLADRTSYVWGAGEKIRPVAGLPSLDAVLVCPLGAAPVGKTRAVFSQLSLPAAGPARAPDPLPPFHDRDALLSFMRETGNDLASPALAVMPVCAEADAALRGLGGCLYVGLSGAGPTSFGIFTEGQHAAAAAEKLRVRHPEWWVAATTLGDR